MDSLASFQPFRLFMFPKRRSTGNPKRRLIGQPLDILHPRLVVLANGLNYSGNPEHKRNPGDFNLSPPSSPRKNKSLCDHSGITRRAQALALLRAGVLLGMISDRETSGWPKNIWAVSEDLRFVFEAQYERPGVYHGYPLPHEDPFRDEVLSTWKQRKKR